VQAWKKLSEKPAKFGWRDLVVKNYQLPDGGEHEFVTINRTGQKSAAVIALTPDNQVIISYQYRPGPDRFMSDIPGGGVEDGEDPALAARRELLEETGYTSPNELEYLGCISRDAYSNETSYYYLATNCLLTDLQKFDDGECVEVMLISKQQLIENAKTNQMTDAVAVLLALDKLQA